MTLGGRLLASCCSSGLSNTQIPTCPFSSISLNYEEENRFITGELVYQEGSATHNYPYADRTQLVMNWNAMGIGGPTGPWKYTVVNTSVGSAGWTVGTNSIVTVASGGPIVRPGTNTVVALVPYKYRSYTFNKTSALGSYRPGTATGGQITKVAHPTACTGTDFPITFDETVEGALVTFSTTTAAPATGNITWVGACSAVVNGMTLVLTASGISTGPWVVEVTGGTLRLTNGAGVTTTYSGLLTTVRNSINAAGRFTATVTANATSSAETQDLKPLKTNPIGVACTIGVPIAFPGDLIAPGSRVVGNQTGVFTLNNSDSFDASTSGLQNDATGLAQYLGAGWYAKLTGSYSGIGGLKSSTGNYFSYNALRWSRTSGVSEFTNDYTLTGNNYIDVDVNIVCLQCYNNTDPSPSCDFGPLSPGFNNVFIGFFGSTGTFICSAGWTDCSGNVVEFCPCPPPTLPGSFSIETQTPVSAPTATYTARQRISGRILIG